MTEQPPPPRSPFVHQTATSAETGPWRPSSPPPVRRHSSMPYPGTNRLAVAAASVGLAGIVPPLVLPMLGSGPLLLLPLVGMVLGIVALAQLRRYPQRGRGMAITGVVLGAGVLALLVLGFAVLLGWFG